MLNSYYEASWPDPAWRCGTRRLLAAGEIGRPGFMALVAASVPSGALQHDGHGTTFARRALGSRCLVARRFRLESQRAQCSCKTGRRRRMVHEICGRRRS
jgi:hypothetical protein